MVCGNTEVSRDGLVAQPTEQQHPVKPSSGWHQIRDRTMWLKYSGRDPGRVDLYVDNIGGFRTSGTPEEVREQEEKLKYGVNLSSKDGQFSFRHKDPYVEAKPYGVAKPYTHLVGHIEGDDPESAVFVIDKLAHGRGVPGKLPGQGKLRDLGGRARQ